MASSEASGVQGSFKAPAETSRIQYPAKALRSASTIAACNICNCNHCHIIVIDIIDIIAKLHDRILAHAYIYKYCQLTHCACLQIGWMSRISNLRAVPMLSLAANAPGQEHAAKTKLFYIARRTT